MEKWNRGLGHLFMTIFLHNYSAFMVIPAITDVTMSALCPGRDECSIAIYLTGFQQAVHFHHGNDLRGVSFEILEDENKITKQPKGATNSQYNNLS
ncbi:hypothetical protein CsatB_008101 [Cannabis sativa]